MARRTRRGVSGGIKTSVVKGVRWYSRAALGAEAAVGAAVGSAIMAVGAPVAVATATVVAVSLVARAGMLGRLASKASRESRAEGVDWPSLGLPAWLGFGARGVAAAVWIQWGQMPWAPVWSGQAQIEAAKEGSGPLVVVCPGYGCTSAPLSAWRRELVARGCRVCLFEYSSAIGSIDGHAREFADFCAHAAEELGLEGVWVLGHSMGGLICVQAALMGAPILGVMAVGSPLGGTLRASGDAGESRGQMERGSVWLSAVQGAWLQTQPAPLRCLWSSSDQMIAPNTSASGERWKAQKSVRWDGVGHLEMLGSRCGALVAMEMSMFVREECGPGLSHL